MKTFEEFIRKNEEKKGVKLAEFDYVILNKKYTFTINKNSKIRLNIPNIDYSILDDLEDASVETAKKKLDELVARVGGAKIISTIEKRREEIEKKKNDTDWELYSEYATNRNSPAFKVYRKVLNGKVVWNQEGKKHIDIHMGSKEDEVKKAIADMNRYYKLKHVSGYNHLENK